MAMKPDKISKELARAEYDDFKRKAIDEAKKRAVMQRVDYETFRNMVLVAHLKPIQAPNTRQDDKMLPSWNFGVDGKQIGQKVEGGTLHPDTPSHAPSTSGDFYRDWRRNCPSPDDKYRYLKLCGPETLKSVFKVEVNAEVLRDMLGVLSASWLSHAGAAEEAEEGQAAALREAAFVVQVLQALTSAGRFCLTVKLLGASAKPAVTGLFDALSAAVGAAEAAADAGEQEAAAATTCGLCSLEQLLELRKAFGLV